MFLKCYIVIPKFNFFLRCVSFPAVMNKVTTQLLDLLHRPDLQTCQNTDWPQKMYTHFVYTNVYTLPSGLQTTILLQPCWVTVLTIKDISASQERLCHLLRKHYKSACAICWENIILHPHPEIEISFKFIPKILMSKEFFWATLYINRLTPDDPYMGRTAPLTSKRCTLYIYSTNIGTEYFKHALYSPLLFSSKFSLFHNANLFGSCIIHTLYTGCAKIKKNNSGTKELSFLDKNSLWRNGRDWDTPQFATITEQPALWVTSQSVEIWTDCVRILELLSVGSVHLVELLTNDENSCLHACQVGIITVQLGSWVTPELGQDLHS